MSTTRAFTLVELVMVIAVTGIIAAIAAPRYGAAVSRYRADLAAKRVAADLALAQHRARVAGVPRSVLFNTSAATYRLAQIPDLKKPTSDYIVNLALTPYHASVNVASMGDDDTITFNGLGVPDSGGTIEVTTGSAKRTVTVDPLTGATTIQ